MPDLCVYPRPQWVTAGKYVDALAKLPYPVWLELKVGKSKPSTAQDEWRAGALNAGARVAVVRTLDEAIEALR